MPTVKYGGALRFWGYFVSTGERYPLPEQFSQKLGCVCQEAEAHPARQ
jgi:hypothetical protein